MYTYIRYFKLINKHNLSSFAQLWRPRFIAQKIIRMSYFPASHVWRHRRVLMILYDIIWYYMYDMKSDCTIIYRYSHLMGVQNCKISDTEFAWTHEQCLFKMMTICSFLKRKIYITLRALAALWLLPSPARRRSSSFQRFQFAFRDLVV